MNRTCPTCHTIVNTYKGPGEFENCPKCNAVFEIIEIKQSPRAKRYHHLPPNKQSFLSNGMAGLGVFSLIIGLLTIGYFGLFYDTTVTTSGQSFGHGLRIPSQTVHNVGKMNNRLVGIIIGGVFALIGTGLIIGGSIAPKDK